MKYEKWSLGYFLLKLYVKLADRIIYKKVIITGKEKIPDNCPIVFAPNHQNALSDPLAVLLNTKFQPVWLARADIFQNKTAAAILKFLKIMPVYRMRDGKENLGKNDETFESSVRVLENNFALGLFPEAAHTGRRQMIPSKKAVPRIVFMAAEKAKSNLNIQVIPTGIYYSSYWKFNRTLILNFGDPIPANDYLEEYKTNPNGAVISLKNRIHEAILHLVIEIGSKKYYKEFEIIREIYGKHYLERQKLKDTPLNRFKSDQLLTAKLDALEAKSPEETAALINEINVYNATVKRLKIRHWLVEKPANNLWKFLRNQVTLILGLPIFVFGALFNAIPFLAIDYFVRKKVKDKAFWSTFFLVLGIIVFPLFYIAEFFLVAPYMPGILPKLAFLAALPLTGKLAFKWFIVFRKTIGRRRLFFLKQFSRKDYYKLFKEKELLFYKMDKMIPL